MIKGEVVYLYWLEIVIVVFIAIELLASFLK